MIVTVMIFTTTIAGKDSWPQLLLSKSVSPNDVIFTATHILTAFINIYQSQTILGIVASIDLSSSLMNLNLISLIICQNVQRLQIFANFAS